MTELYLDGIDELNMNTPENQISSYIYDVPDFVERCPI